MENLIIGLVVEDAPSGVRSGQAAGAKVVAVCTSHSQQAMTAAKPDFLISDFDKVNYSNIASELVAHLPLLGWSVQCVEGNCKSPLIHQSNI